MEPPSEKKPFLLLDATKVNTKHYRSVPYKVEVGTFHWCNDMGCHTTPTHTLHLGGRATRNKNRERRPLYIVKICDEERILVLSSTTRSGRGWGEMPQDYQQYFLPIAPTPEVGNRKIITLEEDPESIFLGKSLLYLELNVVMLPRKLLGYIGRATPEGQKLINQEFHELCHRLRLVEAVYPSQLFQLGKETCKSKSSARRSLQTNIANSPGPSSWRISGADVNRSAKSSDNSYQRGDAHKQRRGRAPKFKGRWSTNPWERNTQGSENISTTASSLQLNGSDLKPQPTRNKNPGEGLVNPQFFSTRNLGLATSAVVSLQLTGTHEEIGPSDPVKGTDTDNTVSKPAQSDKGKRQALKTSPAAGNRARKSRADEQKWHRTDMTNCER